MRLINCYYFEIINSSNSIQTWKIVTSSNKILLTRSSFIYSKTWFPLKINPIGVETSNSFIYSKIEIKFQITNQLKYIYLYTFVLHMKKKNDKPNILTISRLVWGLKMIICNHITISNGKIYADHVFIPKNKEAVLVMIKYICIWAHDFFRIRLTHE